jgi:hypothetical protein
MTAFRHLLLRTVPPGSATRNARGTSLAHGSPRRVEAPKKTHTVLCADPEAGAVGMHSAAVHGRDTGWLPAGWGYKILVMASQNIHSLVVAY